MLVYIARLYAVSTLQFKIKCFVLFKIFLLLNISTNAVLHIEFYILMLRHILNLSKKAALAIPKQKRYLRHSKSFHQQNIGKTDLIRFQAIL